MTTTSSTISLTLYDATTDTGETFSSFRSAQAGISSGSNMNRIDSAFASDRGRLSSLEITRSDIPVSAVYDSPGTYLATGVTYDGTNIITALTARMTIILSLSTASTSTAQQLNINSLGGKFLKKINAGGAFVDIIAGELMIGKNYLFRYDGTQWIWVSANSADQTYIAGTAGNFAKISSTNTLEDSTFSSSSMVTNGNTHDHIGGDGNPITEGAFSFTNVTTANVTTSAHGLVPIAPNDGSKFLRGDATWGAPGGKFVNNFGLSLVSGTYPVLSDQSAKTSLYLTPTFGNLISLFDGTNWNIYSSAEMSIANSGLTASKPYDVFCYANAGVPTMELLVWTNDTTRATALTLQDGVYVKSGATTRRYIGTVYMDSVSKFEDTSSRRCVWNLYNKFEKTLLSKETTDSWTYAVASTYAEINGGSAYGVSRVGVVIGIQNSKVDILSSIYAVLFGAGTLVCATGIGLDSSTVNSASVYPSQYAVFSAAGAGLIATYKDYPSVGFHSFRQLQWQDSTTSLTWWGDNGGKGQSGLNGIIQC